MTIRSRQRRGKTRTWPKRPPWGEIARSESVPYGQGYAAFKHYRKCWNQIGRGGDAQQLYAMVHDKPTEEIVRIMRLAGFSEHAGYIRSGEWVKIDDEEPLAA